MALARSLTAKIYEVKAHDGNVSCLDLGETACVLVTGGQDRNVNLWTFSQDECFMSLVGHNRPVECVRFAYNDNFVYSADDIGIIRRWDLNAQTTCSTLNGHMKSVRTLDFNPSGEYVVSGSNDTTVRLWDVRNQNKCIKVYRGHMAHVNSVKFSPDGLWIASAGTEGSVIIWDIRKSKQIMDFTDPPPAAAITCIQFHPYEFLLAVGRDDGTVCIYDLEREVLISRTGAGSYFYGHPIKCIAFSEHGDCLFVGTAAGISVIGWEPDQEFDQIKSTWTALSDMKVINNRLFCGSYEKELVSINAVSVNRIMPFYNPSNVPPAFSYNATTRKSFSRSNQKLRLSMGGTKPSRLVEENEDNKSPSLDGQSSPNLSLEMVDEPTLDMSISSPPLPLEPPPSLPHATIIHTPNGLGNGNTNGTMLYDGTYSLVGAQKKNTTTPYNFPSMASSTGYSSFGAYDGGPSSLKMPGERDLYQMPMVDSYSNEIEYNFNDSNPPIISNYDHTEMAEDFPVNQNVHQQGSGPNSVSSTITHSSAATAGANQMTKTAKPKTASHIQKRNTQTAMTSKSQISTSFQQRSRLSQVSSVSSTELHKLDDNMLLKKSVSSHVVNKGKRPMDTSQSNQNKENARNKNITVQIITKPPTRSRTTLELRTPQQQAAAAAQRQFRISSYNPEINGTNIPSYRPDPSLFTQMGSNRNNADDSSEIQMLSTSHEQVYQELVNRHATLQLIRNSTRSHDVVGALKQAIKMNGRTVFVDLLGAILEKTSTWNLDLCLLLLPEIYDLLQSQHKFHYTRACDTLRVILSNFLPIIQENLDPWAAGGLGVDVSREERKRKCIECQHWLLQIRNLPESGHFGTTLTQLQNMIVNI